MNAPGCFMGRNQDCQRWYLYVSTVGLLLTVMVLAGCGGHSSGPVSLDDGLPDDLSVDHGVIDPGFGDPDLPHVGEDPGGLDFGPSDQGMDLSAEDYGTADSSNDVLTVDASADAPPEDYGDPGVEEVCTPNCDDRECGDDGCGGVCGTCTGGSCNDLDWTPPRICSEGACLPSNVQNCDDGDPCTADVCDSLTGCQNQTLEDGSICVLGQCQDLLWLKPSTCVKGKCEGGGGTEYCADENYCTDDSCSPTVGCVFVPNTMDCDDENLCTTGDVCTSGSCVGTGDLICSDGKNCTTDSCDALSGCHHDVNEGKCLIEGNCYSSNSLNPLDACQVCVPSSSQIAWTARTCNDGIACTIDLCQSPTGCVATPEAGSCFISSVCYVDGTSPSSNPCQVCNASENPSQWSDVIDGKECVAPSCRDLLFVERMTCVSGQCTGGGLNVSCDDGDECTIDQCTLVGCLNTSFTPCCGNGLQEQGEECDDGNATDWDGCSSCMVAEARVATDVVDGGSVEVAVAAASSGSIHVAWTNSSKGVDCLRLGSTGLVSWTLDGLLAPSWIVAKAYLLKLISLDAQGIVVSWQYDAGLDISGRYAQHLFPDGSLGAALDWRNVGYYLGSITALSTGELWFVGPDKELSSVVAQRFTLEGIAVGPQFTLASGSPYYYDVDVASLVGDKVSFAWLVVSPSYDYNLYSRLYAANGESLGTTVKLYSSGWNRPTIGRLYDGGFVVAFSHWDDNSVYIQRFDSNGAMIGGAVKVNTTESGAKNSPVQPSVAALPQGGFVVVWDSTAGVGATGEILGQRFSADGTKTGGEFSLARLGPLSTPTSSQGRWTPKVATIPNVGFVVAWPGPTPDGGRAIFIQRFHADGERIGVGDDISLSLSDHL